MPSILGPMPVPRLYVRAIRWMEGVFILAALFLLMFLPMPPHGAEIGSFATLSGGIIVAGYVWWGLRVPTRLAWWGALALSGAWLLVSFRVFLLLGRIVVAGLTGHDTASAMDNRFVLSILFALVPVVAQAIVLIAWLRARSVVTD